MNLKVEVKIQEEYLELSGSFLKSSAQCALCSQEQTKYLASSGNILRLNQIQTFFSLKNIDALDTVLFLASQKDCNVVKNDAEKSTSHDYENEKLSHNERLKLS